MTGDVRNDIRILQYPRFEEFVQVTTKDIIEIIKNNREFREKYLDNLNYYVGKNTRINKRKEVTKDNPDSRISVSYARSMTQMVKGYMYKPGLITYASENESYLETLKEIFEENNEELKTSELGENQSKYGLGVELLYIDGDENNTIPRFSPIKPEECIFIFNMEIEASMIGCIRYYVINEDKDKKVRTYRVEVYYLDRVESYAMVERNFTVHGNEFEITETLDVFPNFYDGIPFVLYINNQEYLADYEPVKTLIDAYDIMISDSLDELNRFASAYLVLQNFILANAEDENEKSRALERIKKNRLIEIDSDGNVSFLTRDIPSEFFREVKQTLREDIEAMSHIPDFRSKSFEAKSGEAMKWSLFDFENLAADKQSLFEAGLQERIRLINSFLSKKQIDTDSKVHVRFERNLPVNNDALVNTAMSLKALGLPDEVWLEILKSAELVDDVEMVIEKMEEMKAESMENFQVNIDENKEDDKSDQDMDES